jgi:hypothetical protein
MKNTLATLVRIVRLYAIALWVGGLIFFIVVAGVAFGSLPSTHEAGAVVRGSLIALHDIGLGSGIAYLLATLALRGAEPWSYLRRVRIAEVALVSAMLLLTAYSAASIIPRMERDRHTLEREYNGDMNTSPKTLPEHVEFDQLHGLSTKVESGVLLAGLVVLALAAVQKSEKQ